MSKEEPVRQSNSSIGSVMSHIALLGLDVKLDLVVSIYMPSLTGLRKRTCASRILKGQAKLGITTIGASFP